MDEWSQSLQTIIDQRPPSDDASIVLFTVRPGATATDIGAELERAGLIRSATAFRVQTELHGSAQRLAVGDYELRRNMTLDEVMEMLVSGNTRRTGLLTIREGWRAEEIAQYLEGNGVVEATSLLEAIAGRGGLEAPPLPQGAPSFEGYLFPESYDLGRSVSAETVLNRLVDEFERRVDPTLRAAAARRGLSVHGLVTLASIVEREMARSEEAPEIAAVFHNRLDRGMPLQADPTVQYALVPFGTLVHGEPYWKRELTNSDLQWDSRYNTYRFTGLPPGPICNPGDAALEAAADPPNRPWLYFVARSDGSHLFAETLDGHLQNVARARAGE